jgi:Putative peptidoglycan binding domain
MRHAALAVVITAGMLLPAAMGRTQVVSACDAGAVLNFLTAGLASVCFGGALPAINPEPICAAAGIVVSATPDGNRNSYTYDLTCPDSPAIHVNGQYTFDTKVAVEALTSGPTVTVDWICPHDPWIAPSGTTCSQGTVVNNTAAESVTLDAGNFGVEDQPISTYFLNDDGRLAIFQAQLKYTTDQAAILAAQKEAAARAAYLATQVTPTNSCANCAAAGSTLSPALAPTAAAYHAPSIVAGWPQLSLYTQGEAVTSLQYLLLQSGSTVPVDGKFAASTDAAVRAFQKAQGLTVDGVVGQQTWLALIVSVQQGSQGAAVKAVQSQLKSRNVAITVDGNFGSQTDGAVRSYQQARGLTVDGQVGPLTWQPLVAGK